MGAFLVALAIAAGIALWTASPPEIPWSAFWEKPEFWQTWLPTWFQGVGTLGAVYVAWQVFVAWGAQEQTRRKGELAENVLKAAFVAASAIRYARFPNVGPNQEPTKALIARALRGRRETSVAAMDKAVAELASYRDVAGHMLGEDVGAAIAEIEDVRTAVGSAYIALRGLLRGEFMLEKGIDKDSDKWREVVATGLEVLVKGYGWKVDGQEEDEFEVDLENSMKSLQAALDMHLKFQH